MKNISILALLRNFNISSNFPKLSPSMMTTENYAPLIDEVTHPSQPVDASSTFPSKKSHTRNENQSKYYNAGPVWITTTVAFELFVLYVEKTKAPVYSSLITALGFFYAVAAALPSFIWLAINNWDVSETNITGVTLSECISLSGYSLIPMVPAYAVRALRVPILSKLSNLGGACYSAYFLYRNIWPVLKASPMVDASRLSTVMNLWMANHVVIILLATIVFLH